jgi:hypothetical protein
MVKWRREEENPKRKVKKFWMGINARWKEYI